MRISTAGSTLASLDAMNAAQTALTTSQAQISSGVAIQTPADDPTAYAHIVQLKAALAASTQYATNSNVAQSRLSVEEQTLTAVSNALQSVNQLAVQANDPTLAAGDRQAIATQMTADVQQLVALANTQDSNGEYIFAGNTSGTQPYTMNGNGTVVYNGDSQNRSVQIGPTQTIAVGDSGQTVFGDIPTGNGTFVTGAAAANTGTGVIDAGTVTNAAAWVADNYQIKFNSPTSYEVLNGAATVVSSGTFQSGTAVPVSGGSVTITGQPATGDVFTVSSSGTEDLFTSLNKLVTAVGSNVGTPAAKAQLASALGGSIQQIGQAISHLTGVSTAVGARLQNINANTSAQDSLNVQLQSALSQTQDLNYASAVTQMNLQYTGLQAAQAAYAKFSQLSLFNYL